MRSILNGLVFATLIGTPLSGQSVAGRVVDEDTTNGIPGAVVILLDSDGRQRQAVLTAPDGSFRFTVPLPLSYRLRAEMIGREVVETEVFVTGPDGDSSHHLILPSLPIQLAGLEVNGEERCDGDLQSARSVYLVWAEVEKALRATEVTLAASAHRFRLAEYDRRRRKGSLNVVQEERSESEVFGGQAPFVSLDPSALAEGGYVRDERGGVWIYGPSTEVLLSRSFQETHCFSLRRDGSRPEMIGLEFEPVPGRSTSDIRGVLWVDETSAALRTLEFKFENLPRSLMRGDYEGSAEFRQLGRGGWVIESWWLRSPDPDNLLQVRERAGEILDLWPES